MVKKVRNLTNAKHFKTKEPSTIVVFVDLEPAKITKTFLYNIKFLLILQNYMSVAQTTSSRVVEENNLSPKSRPQKIITYTLDSILQNQCRYLMTTNT